MPEKNVATASDETEKNRRTSLKNTAVFASFTILSRILGLARDMVKAYVFGTGPLAVAFDIAFRIPNMLRNLAAEGAFSQAFVPVYEKYKHEDEGRQAAGAVLLRMFLILSALTVIAYFFIPYLLPWIINDPGKAHPSTKVAIDLTQILFPYILFISMASVFMGIEYSRNLFWAPALGPAFMNFVILSLFGVYIFLFPAGSHAERNIYAWSGCILTASILQMGFQGLMTKKMGVFPKFRFRHPVLKDLWVLMLPGMLAAAAQELGQLADIFMATLLRDKAPEAVSALTYAHRLNHLPIGIFGVAVATASLPQLSRLFKEEKYHEYAHSLGAAVSLNLYLLIPAAVGLIALAEPIIGIIFERGAFNRESTVSTAYALKFYAMGIPAYGMMKLFTSAFYARRNSRTPALITIISLSFNIGASFALMQFMLHAGLAFGSSLAAWLSILLYMSVLNRKVGVRFEKEHVVEYRRILVAQFLWGTVVLLLAGALGQLSYWLQIGIVIPASIGLYLMLSMIFRLKEFTLVRDMIVQRLRH